MVLHFLRVEVFRVPWRGTALSAILPATATAGDQAMQAPSPETVDAVLRHADARLDQSRENLFALLRIPSISAQEVHREDCARAAAWVRDQLTSLC